MVLVEPALALQGRLGIIQTPAIDEKRKLDQGAKCSSHLIHASLWHLGSPVLRSFASQSERCLEEVALGMPVNR